MLTTSLRDLPKYADWLIRVSLALRGFADGEQIHYLEVDSADFNDFIAAVAGRIAARIPRSTEKMRADD
jgi:hypothetical protein